MGFQYATHIRESRVKLAAGVSSMCRGLQGAYGSFSGPTKCDERDTLQPYFKMFRSERKKHVTVEVSEDEDGVHIPRRRHPGKICVQCELTFRQEVWSTMKPREKFEAMNADPK